MYKTNPWLQWPVADDCIIVQLFLSMPQRRLLLIFVVHWSWCGKCGPLLVSRLIRYWAILDHPHIQTGIMCGYIAGVVLAGAGSGNDSSICVTDPTKPNYSRVRLLSSKCSLNWRLMLASPVSENNSCENYLYVTDYIHRWYYLSWLSLTSTLYLNLPDGCSSKQGREIKLNMRKRFFPFAKYAIS
jgi:hypothetical protein